ncbi:ABC-type transport system, involved in lipoprotein release, permease component [Mariniphaga anaerophila]|uniref:ABC-type transport system, involved in lipoprotein release, permease component n=1 Tax=Mariniphaga anaerophila TaxID=1484053 RepID=A0A1M4W3Y0_9BACT|nr:FtsX-like permease family protein [Mariniphaga anaerophila]SHE75926.1 ABC-type transport system, involved in lipoprotein release, permease component [Mariniphaga anaerophila]
MIWSIAWRNVWRNKLRSIIMIAAIALGLFAGVFTMAFMQGAVDARIQSATKTELAHLQVHAPDFLANNDIALKIEKANEMVRNIEALDSVVAASERLIAEPFIMAAHGTGGGKLIGVVPQQEKKVTDIWEKIIDGEYLEHESRMPPVVIGEKLAKRLRLKVGTRINVQMIDRSGDLSMKGYRVSGIYRTTNTAYDESTLFVKFDDLKAQLGMEDNTAHEIAVLLDNGNEATAVKPSVEKLAAGYKVQTWKELSPEMSLLTDSMDQYMYVFILIILLALCFGIINTMLMSVLERVKEIGMLMAVGMNKRRIFFMIILESVMLTVTGGALGILLGSAVTKFFETRPINLTMFSEGLESYGFASQIYTSLRGDTLVTIAILVVITGLLSALWPARKALKLNPAEATRAE